MASIVEFLEARMAEDEEVARASITRGEGKWSVRGDHDLDECVVEGADFKIYDEGGHDADQARHIAAHDPARVLAECAAKRAIIKECSSVLRSGGWEYSDAPDLAELVVGCLAAVYKDHPDYHQEWARG